MSSSSSIDESSTATTTTAGSVTNNATASSKPASDADCAVPTPEQASGVWREFQELSQKLFKHSRAYSEIDKTMDRQSAMELQLRTQQDRIRHLESNQQLQLSIFEERYDEWKEEKTSLELEKKRVEDGMVGKHKQEMLQADRDLRHETEKANNLVKKLERASADLNLAKKDLAVCKDKLRDWEQYTTQLKEVDFESLEGKLTQFFRDCYKLVEAHFGVDLPTEFLTDYSKWERQVNDLKLPLRFPPTNSPAAKGVRMAAALNVIATSLCNDIFKPCFVPESAADSKTIKEVLESMADLRKEEQFIRAVLISMYSPAQVTAAVNRALHITSEDILKCLSVFLGDSVETFGAELVALLERAAAISKEMQQSKMMIEASVEDMDSAGRSEEFLPAFGKPQSLTGPAKFEMLYLFPRFYVPEEDRIVYGGEFLWPEQEVVILAEQELRDFKVERRAKNGRGMSGSATREPKQERRASMVISAENRSMPSSPTSPRTGRFPT